MCLDGKLLWVLPTSSELHSVADAREWSLTRPLGGVRLGFAHYFFVRLAHAQWKSLLRSFLCLSKPILYVVSVVSGDICFVIVSPKKSNGDQSQLARDSAGQPTSGEGNNRLRCCPGACRRQVQTDQTRQLTKASHATLTLQDHLGVCTLLKFIAKHGKQDLENYDWLVSISARWRIAEQNMLSGRCGNHAQPAKWWSE